MLETKKIFNIPFISATWQDVEKHLAEVVGQNKQECWVTANPEILELSFKDHKLKNILTTEAVVFPDGVGILWAAGKLQQPLQSRLSGVDMIPFFKKYSLYLLGSKAFVVKEAVRRLQQQGFTVAGAHHGYFNCLEESVIKDSIKSLKPQILLVGLGMGKQEKWIAENYQKLGVNVALSVGGSFDVIAGIKKRAPHWVQKNNLEWVYRFIQEPARLPRYFSLLRFVVRVLIAAVLGKCK